MATIGAIGFCRFSFLGLGDWQLSKKAGDFSKDFEAWKASVASVLYHPLRMEQRFWFFERLLLPSIAGQTDQDFTLVILTSPEMPALYLDRLRSLVETGPRQLRLVVSEKRKVSEAVLPEVARVTDQKRDLPRPIQFRVDDDDCLSTRYIERLKAAAAPMKQFAEFGVSFTRSLVVTNVNGAVEHYNRDLIFHSVGCALYAADPAKQVFYIGHTQIHRTVPSVLVPREAQSLMCKFGDHDSPQWSSGGVPAAGAGKISASEFEAICKDRFPFVAKVDFSEVPPGTGAN